MIILENFRLEFILTILIYVHMIYTALEIKTFGLGSTIGDIFSEILSNIALCVTSGNEGWPQYLFYLRL